MQMKLIYVIMTVFHPFQTCPLMECPNFKEVMNTWMTKKNYPVLTVEKAGNGKYIVKQERFVYDKTAKLDKYL